MARGKLALFTLAVCLIASAAVVGQEAPDPTKAADAAYRAEDWKAAAAAYEKILTSDENNTGARYRLGVSLLGLGENKAAAEHLQKAFEASPNTVFALALARAYVRTGDKAKMYEVLERSISLGGIQPAALESETDFASVRSEPRFAEMVKRSDLAVNPCKASPEFRQFDFWIGEWDAVNAQGLTVGSSSIQLILGQCVIFENWNTPVSSGKSFNVFNSQDKKWYQTWVDARGTLTHYVGQFVDGKMVLVGRNPGDAEGKALLRMTFSKLPDGSVLQHGESSTDGGAEWTTRYQFTYVKRK